MKKFKKKLKELLLAIGFAICVMIDSIIAPVQLLFHWEIYQITEKYIKSVL